MIGNDLIKRAEKGDEEAAVLIGSYYLEGKDGEESIGKSYNVFREALERNPNSIVIRLCIAKCFYNGIGVEKNLDRAFQIYEECERLSVSNVEFEYATELEKKNDIDCLNWMQSAYERGNCEAAYHLADYYSDAKYSMLDAQKRFYYLNRAYELGSDDAGIDLGYEYVCGHDINPDPIRGINILKEIANKGNTKACMLLYRFYKEAIGVKEDESEAEHWIRKAAENGSEQGMYQYGMMLIKDTGTNTNDNHKDRKAKGYIYLKKAYDLGVEKAGNALLTDYIRILEIKKISGDRNYSEEEKEQYRFVKIKAEEGSANAQLFIGKTYMAGFMVDQDINNAYDWVKKAADGGNIEAKELLAERYGDANGSSVDYYKAEQLYNEIIESNDKKYKPLALNNLAFINFNVIDNKTKAFSLWKQAAELDDKISAYNLGILYYYGYGTDVNKDKAKYWIRKSADWGYELAKNEYHNLFVDNPEDSKDEKSDASKFNKTDIPNGAWKCPKCGSINEAGKGMCPMCGTVKGFY